MLEFLKIKAWYDAYMVFNFKAAWAFLGSAAALIGVYLAGFGDFILGLVEHGAWPAAVVLLAWWYGEDLVAAVVKLLDRIKNLKGRGYEAEFGNKDLEKAQEAITPNVGRYGAMSTKAANNPFRQMSKALAATLAVNGPVLSILTDARNILGTAIEEAAAREKLDVGDLPVLGAMKGADLLRWSDSKEAKELPYPVQTLMMIETYIGYQSEEIEKSILLAEYSLERKEEDNAFAARQVAKVFAMALTTLNNVGETYDDMD